MRRYVHVSFILCIFENSEIRFIEKLIVDGSINGQINDCNGMNSNFKFHIQILRYLIAKPSSWRALF